MGIPFVPMPSVLPASSKPADINVAIPETRNVRLNSGENAKRHLDFKFASVSIPKFWNSILVFSPLSVPFENSNKSREWMVKKISVVCDGIY